MTTAPLAIIGLGYVGLPLAVEFGRIRKTIGFDISAARVAELKRFRDSTLEVDSKELRAAKQLKVTSSLTDLRRCTTFIVTVPTPIDRYNRPDLRPFESASRSVGTVLKKGDVVIYESTVYPGCTEEVAVPILEAESGLKFNRDFFWCNCAERARHGGVVAIAFGVQQCGASI